MSIASRAITSAEGAGGYGETGVGYWQPGIQTLRAEGENRPSRPSNVVVGGAVAVHLLQDPVTSIERTPCISAGSSDHGQAMCGVMAFKAGQGSKARGIGAQEECAPTLSAVASGTNQAPAVYDARGNGGTSLNLNNVCRTDSTVRRLTPLECERLQGYPDGWTDIGEWTDSKGKRHKEADSPRYKALGNSIALPFWFWLLRRISAQYYRSATLGSLFDGIGGFLLCWERCNGKGTALWASEIEEFPMAVTRIRFGEEALT